MGLIQVRHIPYSGWQSLGEQTKCPNYVLGVGFFLVDCVFRAGMLPLDFTHRLRYALCAAAASRT